MQTKENKLTSSCLFCSLKTSLSQLMLRPTWAVCYDSSRENKLSYIYNCLIDCQKRIFRDFSELLQVCDLPHDLYSMEQKQSSRLSKYCFNVKRNSLKNLIRTSQEDHDGMQIDRLYKGISVKNYTRDLYSFPKCTIM